jgi:hypothetical protein
VAGAPPTWYHGTVRLFRRRPVHTFDEAEAYARCHGARSEEIVSVVRLPAAPPPEPQQPPSEERPKELTGESLRQAFEARLRSRAT